MYVKRSDTYMKLITVQLEYDERVLYGGREVETKLEEQLYGTGFELISVTYESSDQNYPSTNKNEN
jgi:hypothetical protein